MLQIVGHIVDKVIFVEQAPYYYALAILHYLDLNNDETSFPEISAYYSEFDNDSGNTWEYLDREVVFDRAVSWLQAKHILDVVDDHFGPRLLSAAFNYSEARAELETSIRAFSNFQKVRDKDGWLKQALKKMYRDWHALKITDSDFLDPDQDWAPIPLDRTEPELQRAIGEVDNTIEQIRGDNGYAANHPEEHRHVLEGLRATSQHLRNGAAVSLRYLQTYAVGPLTIVVRRVGKAATGIAAEAALIALREWLKQKGFDLLIGLFR